MKGLNYTTPHEDRVIEYCLFGGADPVDQQTCAESILRDQLE